MMKVWRPTPNEIEKTEGWGIWNKEVSEFSWAYDETETCYILEGAAIVEDNKGNTIHFKTGDMVKFTTGLTCTWKITQSIKKRYHFG
jgi:uncharacterized cupin superfamily protein